jgi:predicted metal-dependent hydrolase
MTLVMACLWRWYNMQEFSSRAVAIDLAAPFRWRRLSLAGIRSAGK